MLVFDMLSNVGCELYPHSVQHQEPIGFVWVWALVVFKGLYIVVHLLHNLKTLDLNFLHGSHCWILGVPASWIYPICFFTFSTFFTFIKSSFFNIIFYIFYSSFTLTTTWCSLLNENIIGESFVNLQIFYKLFLFSYWYIFEGINFFHTCFTLILMFSFTLCQCLHPFSQQYSM